jgi:hypothetical protein
MYDPSSRRSGRPGSARLIRRLPVLLLVVVATWWLLIAGIVAAAMPSRAASAPKVEYRVAPGQLANVYLPGLSWLPVPVDRQAFDEAERGFRESDEAAIDRAFDDYEWIRIGHGQWVRVVAVDDRAVLAELVEGAYAGRRAWVKARHLVQ